MGEVGYEGGKRKSTLFSQSYFFCLHNCKDFNDYVVISSISLMETFEFKTLAQFVNEKFGLF